MKFILDIEGTIASIKAQDISEPEYLLIVVYICDLLYAYCTRTRLTSVLWKTDNAMAATRS